MESGPIQFYDIVMLVLLLGATAFGAWKGMAWQIASLASLVVSAGVAVRFGGPLAPMFGQSEPWNRFVAMLVLYLATSLAIWVLFRFVAGMIDRVQLREFDRQIGALFGLAKGVLLCLVVTFFAVTLSESARQAVLHSYSGGYVARLIQRATPVLPTEVRDVLGKYIDELDRQLDPNTPPEPKTFDRLAGKRNDVRGDDAEPPTTGHPDAGPTDTGHPDTGPTDTGPTDTQRFLDAVRDAAGELPERLRPSGETW